MFGPALSLGPCKRPSDYKKGEGVVNLSKQAFTLAGGRLNLGVGRCVRAKRSAPWNLDTLQVWGKLMGGGRMAILISNIDKVRILTIQCTGRIYIQP